MLKVSVHIGYRIRGLSGALTLFLIPVDCYRIVWCTIEFDFFFINLMLRNCQLLKLFDLITTIKQICRSGIHVCIILPLNIICLLPMKVNCHHAHCICTISIYYLYTFIYWLTKKQLNLCFKTSGIKCMPFEMKWHNQNINALHCHC